MVGLFLVLTVTLLWSFSVGFALGLFGGGVSGSRFRLRMVVCCCLWLVFPGCLGAGFGVQGVFLGFV